MALENNAICSICGKPYRVCRTCEEVTSFTPWKTITDTLPHYMIYLVLAEYNIDKNKDKAKKELEKCDLSGWESFDDDVKKVIEVIMSNNVKEDKKNATQKQVVSK